MNLLGEPLSDQWGNSPFPQSIMDLRTRLRNQVDYDFYVDENSHDFFKDVNPRQLRMLIDISDVNLSELSSIALSD